MKIKIDNIVSPIICCIILSVIILWYANFFGYSIKQKIKSVQQRYGPPHTYFVTTVYKNGEKIMYVWDEIATMTDSIKMVRKTEAEKFIQKCKSLEK